MRRVMLAAGLVSLSMAAGSCASINWPPTKPSVVDPMAVISPIVAPPPGKGLVVFFRPAKAMGRFIDLSVRDGDAGIGKLANGAYFVHVAEPGTHMFSTRLKVVTRLPVEVEAGETYYVEQTIGVGLVAGPPHLTPVDAGEFQRLKLKPSRKAAKDLKSRRSKP